MQRHLSQNIHKCFSTTSSAATSTLSELKAQLDKQQDMLTQIMLKLSSLQPQQLQPSPPSPSTPPKSKTPRGFLDFSRKAEAYRPPRERARDWLEINRAEGHEDPLELKRQVARCMDCGTPFCQTHTGCPINNLIPEWNELVLTDQWKEAIDRLHLTNNFPEFTGRVCPAPCEGACVAGVNNPSEAVTIKNVEYAIVDHAFKQGWIVPRPVLNRTGKKVGIVGSGPAGLAAADILNQQGHSVIVYERADRIGGLLMYGIPTMKLSKDTVDRRVNLLREEGVVFKTNKDVQSRKDMDNCDAVLLAVGATLPRDLPNDIPGREMQGVYFAMDFLTRNQKDLKVDDKGRLKNQWGDDVVSVMGKDVVVIGGGDTGTDCIGTSVRQFAKSVVNLELMPRPPNQRSLNNPWPAWPKIFRTEYGHGEVSALFGQDPRRFAMLTKRLLPDSTRTKIRALQVAQVQVDNTGKIVEIPNTEKEIPCDVIVLALGFLGPETPMLKGFNVDLDSKGNVKAGFGEFATSQPDVFAAGDCRRGQSLVVWGIREGRDAAKAIDRFLKRK